MRIIDWIYPGEDEETIISLCLKNWVANSKPPEQLRQRLLHQANIIMFINDLKSNNLLENNNCLDADAWLEKIYLRLRIFF